LSRVLQIETKKRERREKCSFAKKVKFPDLN